MDFDKDVSINPDALDIEWVQQAGLYMKYAESVADYDRIVRQKKESLDIVKATVDRELRESAEKKMTEAMVATAIPTDERYKAAYQEYSQALYDYSVAMGAVRAMDHKKQALENLVKLWQGGYFAGPREPRDLSDEMRSISDMGSERQQTEQRKRLNRNRGDH